MSLISQVVLRKKTPNPSNFLGERLTSVCLLISTQGFGLGLGFGLRLIHMTYLRLL